MIQVLDDIEFASAVATEFPDRNAAEKPAFLLSVETAEWCPRFLIADIQLPGRVTDAKFAS